MLENTNINPEENMNLEEKILEAESVEEEKSVEIQKQDDQVEKGHLYVVSTPIGNRNDITQRAISTLKNVDLVVCEEMKLGARLLHQLNLRNELDNLNEQNEDIKTFELLSQLKEGKSLGLVSDCGTPVFADPGFNLVKRAVENNIPVTVVPGASSIMTALVRSTFSVKSFMFAGFLSRTPSERVEELKQLAMEPRTICLLETPYRLLPLLEAAAKVMPNRRAYIGFNLTMPFETHHYGTFKELYDHFSEKRVKAEFVICFEGTEYTEVPEKRERFVPKKFENRESFEDNKFSKGRGNQGKGGKKPFNKKGKSEFERKSEYKGKSDYKGKSEYKGKSDYKGKSAGKYAGKKEDRTDRYTKDITKEVLAEFSRKNK